MRARVLFSQRLKIKYGSVRCSTEEKVAMWPWLLVALAVLLVFFLLTRDRSDTDKERTAAGMRTDSTTAIGKGPSADWDNIDFDAPKASYEEVNDKDINVRSGNGYAIYSVEEPILFDTEKSALRNEAEQKLKNVLESLQKRYKEGEIRVYGYTDAKGSAGYNQQLAEQRAETVRDWLVKNGNIDKNRISIHSVGEARPVGSNESEQGRQQNRRVDIVVRDK